MALFEPGIGYVDIAAGQLKGATNRYVKTYRDLDGLYDWWRRVFAYLEMRGVRPTSVSGLMAGVER